MNAEHRCEPPRPAANRLAHAAPDLVETAVSELFGHAPPALCGCVRSAWLAAQRLEVITDDAPPLRLHTRSDQELPA